MTNDLLQPVRDARAHAEQARADFEHTIAAAHHNGVTMRAIAEAAGLSHQRIHQIIHALATNQRAGGTSSTPTR